MAHPMEPLLPKPEVRGEGSIRYRCAECGELMDPDQAVLLDGKSFHHEHVPEEPSHGS